MMNKKVLLTVVLLLLASVCAYAHDRSDGGYYTMIDETGNAVYSTAWQVKVGDEFLTGDNRRYEITKLEGDTAYVKFIGDVNLNAYVSQQSRFAAFFSPGIARANGGKVAIYHTHSDESYIPTDGAESILGNGGIYKVGDAFASALNAKGLQAIHSNARHDPHDNMAYERSRRTATELLKQQPDAIYDVHRDALPPDAYQFTDNGLDCTKVQLVVGKYGPTGKQAEDYALRVKAAADQQHPGLVKGIFFAKGGDYNQDLHPRALLLEVGSHTNSREAAERGIALFADVVPTVIGATSANPGNTAGAAGFGTTNAGASGASKSIGWIVGLLIVGVVGFLFVSTGGFKEAKAKLRQFGATEFANFLAPRKKKGGKDDNNKNKGGGETP